MADETRKSYPMMPVPHWWALRRKFRAAIPREVSNNYLASALGMTEKSARTNIMPTLRAAGIVDKDNKPTDLAVRWRDDAQYQDVCEQILRAVYPQELRDLAPDTTVGRGVVQTWFANHTGIGESGAAKMASFYLMLLEADVAKQTESGTNAGGASKTAGKVVRPTSAARRSGAPVAATAPTQAHMTPSHSGGETPKRPELHINVQIHIAADAPSEQIEHIFASMGKHLKDFS